MARYEAFNNELLDNGSKDRFDHNSLVSGMLEAYLNKARYEDGGVVRFHTDFDSDAAKAIADATFAQTGYHVTKRQFGLDDALITSLDSKRDPNGNSLTDILLARFMPGTTEKGLRKTMDKTRKSLTYSTIASLGGEIVSAYDKITTTETIANKFNKEDSEENVKDMKDAMKEMNEEYKIVPEDRFKELVEHKGPEQLAELFYQIVDAARRKRDESR